MVRSLILCSAAALIAACQLPRTRAAHTSSRAVPTTIAPAATSQVSEYLVSTAVQVVPPPAVDRPPEIGQESFASLPLHRGPVNAVTVGRDGVYTGSDDGQVFYTKLVPGAKPQLRTQVVLVGSKPILAMAISPNGRYLAVAQTSQVSLYDTAKGIVSRELSRVKGRITALAWDPRGELLAIGRADGDVVVWTIEGPRTAGLDDLRALEFYLLSSAPISGIQFHPSGRIFFAGDEEGSILLWRLIRTEREMGLRDEGAEVDREREVTTGKRVGQIPSSVTDLWLNGDGSVLYAASREGNLYSWKVRGSVPLPKVALATEELLSISGLTLPKSSADLLVVPGRDQRVRFFCQSTSSGGAAPRQLELARTATLAKPLNQLRIGASSRYVWGGDEEGNLFFFDGEALFRSPLVAVRLRQCRSDVR